MTVGLLTERECDVIEALIEHGRQEPAARALGMHVQTLKNHVGVILRKLDSRSMLQAAVRYERAGRRTP